MVMDIEKALLILSSGGELADKLLEILDKELSAPNIPTQTMGGKTFWNTLAEVNGWKLQQNMITHHARILDASDVRIAWGTISGMEKALDQMIHFAEKYQQ